MRLLTLSVLLAMRWSELQPMLRSEAGGAAAYLGDELVIAGGTTWQNDVKLWLTDVQIYQPGSDRWVRGPELPVPLAYGAYISTGAGLEIFGGSDGKTTHRTSWRLDAAKKGWQKTGSIPVDSLLGRAAHVNGSTFLFGGCSDVADLTKCSDAVWRRDGQSEWRRVSAIPGGALGLGAIAVSGSAIYLFGGCSAGSDRKVVNESKAYRYDPETNRWKTIREMQAGNRGLTAVSLGGRFIYLLGGYTNSGFSADVLEYDIQTDGYTNLNRMPVALLGIEFVLNGRKLLGAGGEDQMRSRSARLLTATLPETAQ